MDKTKNEANHSVLLNLSALGSGQQTSQVAIIYYALRDHRSEHLKLMVKHHDNRHYAMAGQILEDIELIDDLMDELFHRLCDQLEINFLAATGKEPQQSALTNEEEDLAEARLMKNYLAHFNIKTEKKEVNNG